MIRVEPLHMTDRQALKAGDTVMISGRHGCTQATVTRLTATQIILTGLHRRERRFNIKTGDEVGTKATSFYGRDYLAHHTPEVEAQILLRDTVGASHLALMRLDIPFKKYRKLAENGKVSQDKAQAIADGITKLYNLISDTVEGIPE